MRTAPAQKRTTFEELRMALAAEAAREGPQAKVAFELLAHRYRIGGEIAVLRARRGLTPQELAARSGVAQGDVLRIERGAQNAPLDTLAKLAVALGAEIEVVPVGPPLTRSL